MGQAISRGTNKPAHLRPIRYIEREQADEGDQAGLERLSAFADGARSFSGESRPGSEAAFEPSQIREDLLGHCL